MHQNPRTVELPRAEPIDETYRDDYRNATASVWRRLDLYQSQLLANNPD